MFDNDINISNRSKLFSSYLKVYIICNGTNNFGSISPNPLGTITPKYGSFSHSESLIKLSDHKLSFPLNI